MISDERRQPPVVKTKPQLTLGVLVEGITGRSLPSAVVEAPASGSSGGWQSPVTDAAIDSREVKPGGLFVAFKGARADGHDYLAEAFERGAGAALIERPVEVPQPTVDLRGKADFEPVEPPLCLLVEDTLQSLQSAARHWRGQLDLRVIGITGSVGKSTTKELTADVLQRRFNTHKNQGNLNNEIGLPISLLQLTAAHQRAVLEMGFYVPGEIALLCEIAKPQVGVLTNISQVHLERAGSMQAIVDGKAELVESLPGDGVAILNYDDQRVRDMASRTQAQVFTYGLDPEADLSASEVEGLGLEGVRFVLQHQGESFHVRVPLLGRHSVHTALRAAAVGLVEGLNWDEIISGLQHTSSQLRLVAVNGPGGAILLDDTYNAAPPSVLAALNLLGELEGRRIAVLGDMLELGEFEEAGHRMVGARAAEIADELVTVGARARWIGEEALRAGLADQALTALDDSESAIEHLAGRVGAGDVVLVKGSRGVRMDKIVNALEEDSD